MGLEGQPEEDNFMTSLSVTGNHRVVFFILGVGFCGTVGVSQWWHGLKLLSYEAGRGALGGTLLGAGPEEAEEGDVGPPQGGVGQRGAGAQGRLVGSFLVGLVQALVQVRAVPCAQRVQRLERSLSVFIWGKCTNKMLSNFSLIDVT